MTPTICLGCKQYITGACSGMTDASFEQCQDYTPKRKEE